jgi:hypothetical protein
MDDEAQGQATWPANTWRLRLCLDISSSRLPAIQYAIFCEEPIAKFKAVLSRMEKPWAEQLNQIDDAQKRHTVKELQRASAWKHLFRSVPGDEVYLLIPGSSDIALMSNALAAKKWVVSMPVQIEGRRLCWSVPFEAVAGSETAINLTEDTALDLAMI